MMRDEVRGLLPQFFKVVTEPQNLHLSDKFPQKFSQTRFPSLRIVDFRVNDSLQNCNGCVIQRFASGKLGINRKKAVLCVRFPSKKARERTLAYTVISPHKERYGFFKFYLLHAPFNDAVQLAFSSHKKFYGNWLIRIKRAFFLNHSSFHVISPFKHGKVCFNYFSKFSMMVYISL